MEHEPVGTREPGEGVVSDAIGGATNLGVAVAEAFIKLIKQDSSGAMAYREGDGPTQGTLVVRLLRSLLLVGFSSALPHGDPGGVWRRGQNMGGYHYFGRQDLHGADAVLRDRGVGAEERRQYLARLEAACHDVSRGYAELALYGAVQILMQHALIEERIASGDTQLPLSQEDTDLLRVEAEAAARGVLPDDPEGAATHWETGKRFAAALARMNAVLAEHGLALGRARPETPAQDVDDASEMTHGGGHA